jgi:secreted PhoX family phosphatase
MGFFPHEAVAVDARTGTVYLTEDRRGTPASFFYRYRPFDRRPRPGALQAGGVPEAMAIESAPSADPDFFSRGQRFGIVWRQVEPSDATADAAAKGCIRFNRLEGCHFAAGAVWFADTSGGEDRLGQVYRYMPARNVLELFYEGTTRTRIERPDNVTITPWGDLWWAEDGESGDRVMGITPAGDVYRFATNRLNMAEFAGPCFSPSGQTFFINVLSHGLTRLEAAAYDRLGVALT